MLEGMAEIHHTTLSPSKVELVAPWLPHQPWYIGTGTPQLSKPGGWRLDDPEGEVGIEFMVATDESGDEPVHYHVPLTYRGSPLAGAEDALLGTSEHGVLGRRWIYDGAHDPVLVTQLLAAFQGASEPQKQMDSYTPDPTVACHSDLAQSLTAEQVRSVRSGPDGTDVVVAAGGQDVTIRLVRVLGGPDQDGIGHITAGWPLPSGEETRSRFAVLRTIS